MNCNLFAFLKNSRQNLKNTLLEPSAFRYSKMVLGWVGKQVERQPRVPEENNWGFLYLDIIELIKIDQNACIYYLLSLMLELGLGNLKKEEEVFARLMSLGRIR